MKRFTYEFIRKSEYKQMQNDSTERMKKMKTRKQKQKRKKRTQKSRWKDVYI